MLDTIRNIIITVADWFYTPFRKFIPQTIFRYGFTGGLNMVLDIFLYYIFYNFVFDRVNFDLGFVVISPHIAAFITVFPITFVTGFLLAKYITFTASTLHGAQQFIRYGISVAGSILLNYVLLKFFVEYCGLYATLSKIITTALVTVYSYFMQMYFSFAKRRKESAEELKND